MFTYSIDASQLASLPTRLASFLFLILPWSIACMIRNFNTPSDGRIAKNKSHHWSVARLRTPGDPYASPGSAIQPITNPGRGDLLVAFWQDCLRSFPDRSMGEVRVHPAQRIVEEDEDETKRLSV